jgi:hypothetical protein
LLGLGTALYINLIGQLYVSELCLLIAFPFLVIKGERLLSNNWIKRIIIFGYLWLLSQIITDLVRSTPIDNLARGIASIIVFIIGFLSLWMIISKDILNLKIYILGVCVGGFLQTIYQPNPYFAAEPWKFGYGPIVILLILLVSISLKSKLIIKYHIPALLLIGVGSFSFYNNSRSIGLFALLTGFSVLIASAINRYKVRKIKKGYINILLLFLILGVLIFGISKFYELAADNGWLGATVKQKYEIQSGGIFGVLVGGRAEIFSAIHAIIDSPIIGHGSWADDAKYRVYLYDVINYGYNTPIYEITNQIQQSDLIPTHSHLFQNWVWAGILGALFWILILVLVIRSLIANIYATNPLSILVIYYSFASIWDIFFSPFGSVMRMEWALRLVVFILSIFYLNNSVNVNNKSFDSNNFIQPG